MKLHELPQEIQDKLNADRDGWKGHVASGAYGVTAYNKLGTRYFMATRRCVSWYDLKGHSMPFGGGTYWEVRYGEMKWSHNVRRNPLGERYDEYSWVHSTTYRSVTNPETGEVVEIPGRLDTKKEVMALLKKLEFKGFDELSKEQFFSPKAIEIYPAE
jgi:hypothetical protein